MNSNQKQSRKQRSRSYPFRNLEAIDQSLSTVKKIHEITQKVDDSAWNKLIELNDNLTQDSLTFIDYIAILQKQSQEDDLLLMQQEKQYQQTVAKHQQTLAKLEQRLFEQQESNKIVLECLLEKDEERKRVKQNLEKVRHQVQYLEKTVIDCKAANEQAHLKLVQLEIQKNQSAHQLNQMYYLKRVLNNQLQTLRGNIRVYCRIRPAFQQDHFLSEPFYTVKNGTISFSIPKEQLKSDNYKKDFVYNFEEVFNNASQQKIFQQFEPLIDSVLDGKNVCIFAYGQTGSGKTYTMQGDDKNMGIIPRSIKRLFDQIHVAKSYNWNFSIEVQCVQIYNDDIRDLFGKKKDGTNSIKVNTADQINYLLEVANANRKVAGTNCNQRSSRSHLIFMVKLFGKCGENLKQSCLCLVDLAGSERINVSKVEGERLKETQHINKSLSTLGLVIQNLVKKSQHIPFRNSKLTSFLEPFLIGQSKTVMMMCVSPLLSDWAQTQASLVFSQSVKKVTT